HSHRTIVAVPERRQSEHDNSVVQAILPTRADRSVCATRNGKRDCRSPSIGLRSSMKRTYWVLLALALAVSAGAQTNPFLTPSPLPYQAPPFDKIKDA